MKVVVLGAGVLGVTTAYELARRGHEVEVVERQEFAAQECSFANGGQLSYSHAEPWANPHVFPLLFKWMFKEDAPLVLRPRADAAMIEWGLRFLWNCQPARARKHSAALLRLGLYSREKMHELLADTGVEFHHLKKGILHVFSEQAELEDAKKQVEFQQKLGCEERILTHDECLAMEPALQHSAKPIIGGIHAPMDESGDIHVFTQSLAKLCAERYGVTFTYQTDVQRLHTDNGKIISVATNRGNLQADAYVMALGAASPLFLKPVGIKVPIYPMKGYSLTFDADEFSPHTSITDGALKIVYTRLGDKVRVAGTAEFAGYNTEVRESRITPMLRGIQSLFPKADLSNVRRWSCLRPSTPDGPPTLGATRQSNLFLNTGHGTLGWTQAAASAAIVADAVEGKQAAIALDGLDAMRYA